MRGELFQKQHTQKEKIKAAKASFQNARRRRSNFLPASVRVQHPTRGSEEVSPQSRTVRISRRCGSQSKEPPSPASEGRNPPAVMGVTTQENGCLLFCHNLSKENTFTHVRVILAGDRRKRESDCGADTPGQNMTVLLLGVSLGRSLNVKPRLRLAGFRWRDACNVVRRG